MSGTARVAKRRDLHDGISIWRLTSRKSVRTVPLPSKKNYDIVIVGAGITGALCAVTLAAAGYEVAVLDRRVPASGSTLASTALIQFEIDTPLLELVDRLGERNATRAYLRSLKAVNDLKTLIDRHGIDAEWAGRPALYIAGNRMGFRGLQAEAAHRRSAGLPCEYLSAAEVQERFGIITTGAILSSGSAEIDPVRTAQSCIRTAARLGATIISPCNVVDVCNAPEGIELETDRNRRVICQRLVFATGYETPSGIPKDAFEIVSSWAIATKRLSAESFWAHRALIWEAADPYLYVRTTRDDRIIAGGEDSALKSPKRREAAIPAKSHKILVKLRRLLSMPKLEVDYAWAGAFAESSSGLPVLRPHPTIDGAFVVLGCGGNGITFSMIASQLIAAWLSGRRDPDAALFAGD